MVTARRDPASTDRSEPDYRFDFCGGQLAVDFTNTVGSRGDRAEEHFNTIGDIVSWAEARGLVSKAESAKARRAAAAHPERALGIYHRAIELREALYRIFVAAAEERPAAPSDLARLNRFVSATFSAARIAEARGRFSLDTSPSDELDRMLALVVRSAVELLTTGEVAKVGLCADHTCRWLFLDTTRSRTRRWCDMKSCGNRNKVRRFRAT